MRTFALLVLLSLSFGSSADDYLWFERDWMIDVDATVKANPKMESLNPALREKFKNRLREARWRISNGILTSVHEGMLVSEPYSIRMIDASRFELIVDEQGGNTIFKVTRTARGFCALLDLERFEPLEGIRDWTECYVPESA